MYRLLLMCLAIPALLAGCAGDPEPGEGPSPAELGPEAVVEALLEAVAAGEFGDAAALTDTRQAALLTLAEGVDATEVVRALEDGGQAVTVNFWSGFAQTLESGFQPGTVTIEAGEPVNEDGTEFVPVRVIAGEDDVRTFHLRRDEAWVVDLVATFAPILAERLVARIDMLLGSANVNAGTVLAEWSRTLPSLRVAAQGDISPGAHQSLIALMERISRFQ